MRASSPAPARWLTALLLLAVVAAFAQGCATTADNSDSDLPWSTPQTWESAPTIPGLNDRR